MKWVLIAQLVEHCSANAEAMGSNPVEASPNNFSGEDLQLPKLPFTTAMNRSPFYLYSRGSNQLHFMSKFAARQTVSLIDENEKRSQNFFLKVAPRSTFRNNFLQPATNVFEARQGDHAR